MLYYLLAPSLLLIISPLMYLCNRRVQIVFAFFVITMFVIFCGLRWYASDDYGAYISIFEAVPPLTEFTLASVAGIHSEIGYKALNSLLKTLSFESYAVMFFLVALSLFIKFAFYLKLTKHIFFCVCFYLALHFFRAEFIQVRIAVGAAVLCIALLYYFKENYVKFAITVLIATTIHSVCAVFLVLLVTRNFKMRNLLVLALILPVLFSFISLLKPLLELASQMSSSLIIKVLYNYAFNGPHGDNVSIYNLTPLRHFLIVIGLCVFYQRMKELDVTSLRVIKVYLSGIFVTSFFMDVELVYARAIYLFDILEPLVLCILVSTFNSFRARASMFFIATCLALTLMYISALANSSLYPYQTWLNMIV